LWQCYIGLYIFGVKEKLLEATLIILVGGESRRMGFPKPLLLINRKNLVEIIIERLKILFSEIIVVGKGKQRIYGKEFIFVEDLYEYHSPLVGIYSGLKVSKNQFNFIVACDMPFVNKNLVKYMLKITGDYDVVVSIVRGYFEPLHAVYTKNTLNVIEEEIERGNLKVTSFYERVNVKEIPEKIVRKHDPELMSFINLNTPKDLKKYASFLNDL